MNTPQTWSDSPIHEQIRIMNTQPTPETDAAYKNHAADMHDHIPLDFARELQRERDEAREDVATWKSRFSAMERAGAEQARRADENQLRPATTNDTPTPETDANAECDQEDGSPFAPVREWVHAGFARRLERERDEARHFLTAVTKQRDEYCPLSDPNHPHGIRFREDSP